MRTSAFLPALLIAASASAQTYTNNLNSSDPAASLQTAAWIGQYDLSSPYPNLKPWDVTTTDGTYRIAGQATVTDAYVDQYPGAATAGGQSFNLTFTLPGLTSFTLADLSSVSIKYSTGELNTAGAYVGVALVSDTSSLFLYMNSPTVTRVNDVLNFTNLGVDAQNRTFTGIRITPAIIYTGGPSPMRNQYADYTFDYVSVTVGNPVPEPSTYGLALGGLALVAVAVRRRAKK